MSAQANLVAFDGASTPVSHTLIPMGTSKDGGESEATWSERLPGVPFEAQVSVTTRQRFLKNGYEQVSLATKVSVMESISGQNAAGYTAAPAIAFTDTIVTTGYFHKRSSLTQRRLVRQLHVNAVNGFTATYAAATTGPSSELFDQGIMVS